MLLEVCRRQQIGWEMNISLMEKLFINNGPVADVLLVTLKLIKKKINISHL